MREKMNKKVSKQDYTACEKGEMGKQEGKGLESRKYREIDYQF